MFTIIGGDGREYGPATADQLRAWINAGRANLDTKAKVLGSEEWRRLGDFAEFAAPSSPPALGGVVVPPIPMAAPMPAATTTPVIVDINLAERGPRLLARAIDWAIEMAIAIPGGVILGSEFLKLGVAVMQGRQPDFEELNVQRLVLGGVVLGVAWLLLLIVQVWMLSTRGQSIGKRLIGLRIVKLDGTSPGFVHAWLMREFLMSVFGGVISILPIIGPIMLRPALHVTDWCMIFRDDRRCLHDLIATTKVVKA